MTTFFKARRAPKAIPPDALRLDRPVPEGVVLDRRRFLTASLGTVGAYAVAAGGAAWIVSPDKAWAMPMDAFDDALARTLLQMTRAVYPHEFVGDVYYAKVVKDLDAKAAGGFDDTTFIDMMREGAAALDEAAGGDFAATAPEAREAILREIAQSHPAFFQAVRGTQVVSLYNQPEVWALFGYEGPSYEKGGYLYNGFDDISWLPDPPAEASPPVAALEEAAAVSKEEYKGPVGYVPLVNTSGGGN
jgi:hypothetical protein